jgi:hypothetical protein
MLGALPEDPEVSAINELLLSQVTPRAKAGMRGKLFGSGFRYGQRWLAPVPLSVRIPTPDHIIPRIRLKTLHPPYCLTDARFAYTLSVWRPYLKDAVFICVFRDPHTTAQGLLEHCKTHASMHSLRLTYAQAVQVWTLMYQHVLYKHAKLPGQWVFVHKDQLLAEAFIQRLEAVLSIRLERAMAIEEQANASSADKGLVGKEAQHTYQMLCDAAGFGVGRSQDKNECVAEPRLQLQ